jgi:hypothetical protein
MDLTIREWSSILGVLAFAGVLWRTIEFFTPMTSLERVLSGLLIAFLIVGAIGTYNLDRNNAPASGVVPYAIALRVLCLLIVAAWPAFVGRTGTFRERLGLKH